MVTGLDFDPHSEGGVRIGTQMGEHFVSDVFEVECDLVGIEGLYTVETCLGFGIREGDVGPRWFLGRRRAFFRLL